MGEKRVLGDAGCMLPLVLGGPQCFSLAFHSVVTLRMSWYAPPDTVGIKFVTSYRRISAINRRCRPDLLVCTFLRGGFIDLHAPRLPFQGRLWNVHSHGFPYEGKLSADRLTDEVDSAS